VKTFPGELERTRDLLKAHTPFALARFGHAEMEILQGRLMHDREVSGGHEYRYAPADPGNEVPRQRLWDSFTYSRPNYLVGINCPHCGLTPGREIADFEWMRENSGQPEDRLTFATVYFYSNYPRYLREVLPLYNEYKTSLVCNHTGNVANLPFQPVRVYRNSFDAWRRDWNLVEEIRNYIGREQIRGALFLFCAGALGCILAHQLFSFCPENSYLDIGSSLDPYIYNGALTRRYLKQDAETQARESCCWMPRASQPSAAAAQ
jgi:hypothetical protein